MKKIKKILIIIFLLSFNIIYCFSFIGSKPKFTEEQETILKLVNEERQKKGVAPLKLNKTLNDTTLKKSNDMAVNKYFSHNSKKLGTPFDLMKKNGVKYRIAGENIAMGQKNPREVMKSWMNSKGHRENILNSKFTEMGISRDSYNKNIWTQHFIGNNKK